MSDRSQQSKVFGGKSIFIPLSEWEWQFDFDLRILAGNILDNAMLETGYRARYI